MSLRCLLIPFVLFFNVLLAQDPTVPLEIHPLTGDFYVFKTYNMYKDIRYPANGLYVVTTGASS